MVEIQIYLPSLNRTEKLWIEQKSYQKNRKAIDRTEKLSIEQKSYQLNRKAIDRTEKLSIEQKRYRQKKMAIDRICISPCELNIVRKEITYIRNQMQRGFLNMYDRLEIAVL